jgi:hypothetical protein
MALWLQIPSEFCLALSAVGEVWKAARTQRGCAWTEPESLMCGAGDGSDVETGPNKAATECRRRVFENCRLDHGGYVV